MCCRPRARKESDTTERLNTNNTVPRLCSKAVSVYSGLPWGSQRGSTDCSRLSKSLVHVKPLGNW